MDSLQKRFAVRFSTQIIAGIMTLVMHSLMFRGLGPKRYGDYNFTTQFFTQITAFLDLGVTTAFFTKISQRPNDSGLIRFYFGYWFFVTLVQALLVFGISLTHFSSFLWPGQVPYVIFSAMIWAVLNSVWQGTSRIADAYALTIRSEKYKVVMRIFSLLIILPFFFNKSLNLDIVFGSQILGFTILSIALYRMSRPCPDILKPSFLGGRFPIGKSWSSYAIEMREFCSPLIIYSGASVFSVLFDSWVLQRYGGSMQQGFLGLSTQLSLVCLLFTSAILPLLHREFSVAVIRKEGTREIYLNYVPQVLVASAFIALFISINCREIIFLYGGPESTGAVPVVIIGILYTIPQSFCQLTGGLFYATNRTKVFRSLGLLSCFLGMPLTLILVGPVGIHGGAVGLVLKTLVVSIIIMLIQLYLTAKQLQLSFFNETVRYGRVIFILGGAIYLSYVLSAEIFSNELAHLLTSLSFSILFATVLVVVAPRWICFQTNTFSARLLHSLKQLFA